MQANKWQAVALVAGLMVSLSAGAQESARAPRTGGGFGNQGGIVISTDAQASFGYATNGNDGVGFFVLEPGADYFFKQNLSLGGALRLRAYFGDADATGIGLNARVGYNLPLGERISLWPKFGLGLNFGDNVFAIGTEALLTDATLVLDAYSPVLFHVTSSFFVGIGPRLGIAIGDDVGISFSVNSTLGGHF
jgi:hypothetical protein